METNLICITMVRKQTTITAGGKLSDYGSINYWY